MSELHNALVFLYAQGTLIAPALEGRPVEPHAYARQALRAMKAHNAPRGTEQLQSTMFDEFRLTDCAQLTCPYCQGHGSDEDMHRCDACAGRGDVSLQTFFEEWG